MFGRIYSRMIPELVRPMAFAEVTKSRSHTEREVARVNRAKMGILKIPIAIMLLMIPGPRIDVISIALRTAGNP